MMCEQRYVPQEQYDALKARLESAVEVLRDLIENDRIGWRGTHHVIDGIWTAPALDEFICEFCDAPANKDSSLLEHTEDCPVTKARAVLASATLQEPQ